MEKIHDMQIFAHKLEQNIKLYDIVCRNLFPGNYISFNILECLEHPSKNQYIGNRLKSIYKELNDEVKSEMNSFCKEIGFVLD